MTRIFIVISYATAPAAECASEMSADSNVGLWHVGVFMSPSCEYEAATQLSAHTGLNAQSPHSFHGCRRSNRSSADARQVSLRSSMCPVDIASCPVKPGQAY